MKATIVEIVLLIDASESNIEVRLTAQKQADWCVIAKIANGSEQGPSVVNVNRVTESEPDLDLF